MILFKLVDYARKYYWILQLLVIVTLSYLLIAEKSKSADYQDVFETSMKEVQIWRDEAGKNRSRVQIAEIDAANAKFVLESNLKETIRKEVGNLKRNLISYSSVNASTTGSIHTSSRDTIFVINDSPVLPAKKISLKEPNLDFNGIYIPSLDTLMAHYRITHDFDITYYYKRPGKKPFNFFRRKQAVAEIKFDNPNSQADSLYSIVMERKQSFFKRIFQ